MSEEKIRELVDLAQRPAPEGRRTGWCAPWRRRSASGRRRRHGITTEDPRALPFYHLAGVLSRCNRKQGSASNLYNVSEFTH